MQAIEFRTTIKDGIIEVPRQYLGNLPNRVRVILLVEQTEQPPGTAVNFIDQLLAHPVHVQGFRPLTREEIYAR